MESKFKQIYYSSDAYWGGKSAIQKHQVQQEGAEKWLLRLPLYQISLPRPQYISRPNASMSLHVKPNNIHQADILYLPHGKYKRKNISMF